MRFTLPSRVLLGKLLIVTGGSLKPEKCFYQLIDFAWTRK